MSEDDGLEGEAVMQVYNPVLSLQSVSALDPDLIEEDTDEIMFMISSDDPFPLVKVRLDAQTDMRTHKNTPRCTCAYAYKGRTLCTVSRCSKHSSPPLSVQAATIVKLVERLTFEKFIDIRFQGKFLLTFRAFMTPAMLFEALQKRCVECRNRGGGGRGCACVPSAGGWLYGVWASHFECALSLC